MRLDSFGTSVAFLPAAAAQQALLTQCVYADRRDLVEQLLGDDGQVLDWHRSGSFSWPPDWAVIKSGGERYFVVIAGSTNPRQHAGHIVGSVVQPFDSPPYSLNLGGGVNYPWYWAALEVASAVKQHLPPTGAAYSVFWSGHSYGAALAQINADLMARNIVLPIFVQCLTFGSPKVWTAGLTVSPRLEVWHTIQSAGDLVTASPPAVELVFMAPPNQPFDWRKPWWYRVSLSWRHYGTVHVLQPDGGTDSSAADPSPLPPYVAGSAWLYHSMPNYYGRVTAPLRGVA